MKTKIRRSVATLVNKNRGIAADQIQRLTVRAAATFWTFMLLIQPAAAQSNGDSTVSGVPCNPPEPLVPLFEFLNSLTELAFLAGVGLATLTFVVAGLLMIAPDPDLSRLAKKIAKNGFIGAILLLSAEMIVSYLIVNLAPNFC